MAFGIGFLNLLTLIFVVFKLLGTLTWSWWLVFLPSIISFGLPLLIWLFFAIVMLVGVALK